MKKVFKKSIILLLAVAMALPGSTVVFGAVEPQGSASILATQDFEGANGPSDPGQNIYLSGGIGVTEANGNNMAVGMSYAGSDSMGEAGRVVFQPSIFAGSPQKYLISFDMKLLQQKPVRFYIWDAESKAMGFFIYTSNGKIAFMTSAANPDIALRPTESTSSYGITDYELDKWTSIDMMVDAVNHKASYYADGVHLCDADMPASASAYPKYFLAQMNTSATSENFLCVDNVSVTVPTEDSFYGQAALDGENISVSFSETPVQNDLSGIEVTNTETGAAVSIGTPVLKGKTLTIPYTDTLESAAEYCVKIPKEVKSVAGNELYSSEVYFTAPVTGGVEVPVFENDFNDYSAAAAGFETPEGWYARTDADVLIAEQPYTAASYSTTDSSSVYITDGVVVSAGEMVQMTGGLAAADHTWAASAARKDGYSAIKTPIFGTSDPSSIESTLGGATKYTLEFDYCIPTSGSNGWTISLCYLGPDVNSRLDSNFTLACNGTVTTYVPATGKTGTQIVAATSSQPAATGSWHKIRIDCDTAARTVKATVDGSHMFYIEMTDEANKDIWKYITGFRVLKGSAGSPLYIDNVRLSKMVSFSESLTKVFKTEGASGGYGVQFAPSTKEPAVLTKNFGEQIAANLTLNFDVKPVAQDLLENKLFIYLPPAAADATGATVAATSNSSPYLLCIKDGELKLNSENATGLAIAAGSWYNVSLRVGIDGTISAKAKAQGESIWTDLGTAAYPALFSGVMSRVSFNIPENSAPMVLDNVDVLYEVAAFRINKIRLYDVFNEDFGPLQTTSSMVKTAKIYFSEAVADPYNTINDTNILISNGVGPCGFGLIDYDASAFVATIEFDSFLKKGERYAVSTRDDAVYAVSGTELKAYTTMFDITADGVYEYDFSKTVDDTGAEVTGSLTGANILYAEGYALNTTEENETLAITIAAYKTSADGVEMLGVDDAVVNATASSYYVVDKNTNALSVSISDPSYYAKTFAVNMDAYSTAENAKAKQNGDYKIQAEIASKQGNTLYIEVRDSQGTPVYKDVRTPAQDGTEVFDIVIPNTTLTDDYTAKIYNDADMTVSTSMFVYANPNDTSGALSAIEAANGDTEDIEDVLENPTYALALGLSGDMQSKMNIAQTVQLLLDWESKAGNTLTTDNVTGVLNQLAAITVVLDGNTGNLFDNYSDELKLDDSEIKNFYKKYYVTAAIEETVTEAMSTVGGASTYTAEDFYDDLYEKFVLAVVANPDGYSNAKEVIEAFKNEIVGATTISDKAYIYIANKSFDSFASLGTELKNYQQSLAKPPVLGGGGGGGASAGVSDTVIGTGQLTNKPEENYTGNGMNVDIFEDLEDVSWARNAIVYLAENGIVGGKSEKIFAPNDNVLREELAKILVGAFIDDAEEADISFGDVDLTQWYAPFIKKAYGAGVINGYNANTFGIGDKITREDMAVMIYNSAKKSGLAFETKEFELFSDDDRISDYAKEAVYTLRNEGVINGVDLSNFAPKAFATRAEVAKIVYSLLKF